MLPPIEQILESIHKRSPGAAIESGTVVLDAKDVADVCHGLKASKEYELDYLANLTVVDYPPERLEVVYHLYSIAKKHGPVALKVKLPRATPTVPSLTPIYRGAEYQEREAWDLFGVTFQGHPDLRRILMWEGFAGHPMRKDYEVENQDEPLPKVTG
jgi:NADH/F420H2 dehydrogenase subunit C